MSPVRNIALVAILGSVFAFALLTALQFVLSAIKSKWPGLILPALSFVFSVIFTLRAAFIQDRRPLTVVLVFLFCNIATVVFSVIYLALGKRRKEINPIDKMNIQDL